MTTTVTTTTVPCSYYLSAQAESAMNQSMNQFRPKADYLASFGHSPECSVYAEDFKAQAREAYSDIFAINTPIVDDALKSAFHFSKCGSNVGTDPRAYLPRGVSITHIGGPFNDFYCCGACTLRVPEIRLWYFPASSNPSCSRGSANTTSRNGLSSDHNQLNKRIKSILNGSTLVTDGYTL